MQAHEFIADMATYEETAWDGYFHVIVDLDLLQHYKEFLTEQNLTWLQYECDCTNNKHNGGRAHHHMVVQRKFAGPTMQKKWVRYRNARDLPKRTGRHIVIKNFKHFACTCLYIITAIHTHNPSTFSVEEACNIRREMWEFPTYKAQLIADSALFKAKMKGAKERAVARAANAVKRNEETSWWSE